MEKMEILKEKFNQVLKEMEQLAKDLDFEGWARIFRKGYQILEDENILLEERLSMAYQKTNVFGGMSSWLDSPPCYAHLKGITKRFDTLTEQLYDIRKEVKIYLSTDKNT